MELVESSLPWSGAPARGTGELRDRFAAALPPALRYHLPRSIVLLADPGVPEARVCEYAVSYATPKPVFLSRLATTSEHCCNGR